MCRNIKTLFNFDPPVTPEEIKNASLQFVRKISGFNKPSRANEASFLAAVDEIAEISTRLIHSLETNAPPRNREEQAAKAKARTLERVALESAHLVGTVNLRPVDCPHPPHSIPVLLNPCADAQ
jgi:hypothetical protein